MFTSLETEQLVSELALAMNTTVDQALSEVVKEKLNDIRARERRFEELSKMAEEISKTLKPKAEWVDPDTFLYDEMGLPK